MTRSCSRRGLLRVAIRARHILVAGVGATLLVGLLVAGAANAAPAATDNGSTPHSAFVVQRDATIMVGASNTARSHRVAVAGAFFSITGLAAIAAGRVAARLRHTPRHRRESFHARLRAPPSLLVVAH